MPRVPGIAVVRSSVHGYGVVATRRLAAGEVVLEGDGVCYHDGDDFDDTYALVMPAVNGGPAFAADVAADPDAVMFCYLVDQSRWINHSCDPNTRLESAWDGAAGITRTRWIAVREIAPGEELSFDYAFAVEDAKPCRCGAAACRGVIVDVDEIERLPAELRRLVRAAACRASSPGA